MATINSASIVPFQQPKRPMTDAERARNYRLRKKARENGKENGEVSVQASPPFTGLPTRDGAPSRASRDITCRVTKSRRSAAAWLLILAAFALAAVGITMNGWFARSLGSSDIAGWLFLAIGVAADCVALAVPSCAARMWLGRQRASALAGWLVWAMTFAFAVTAGIGFASINITDVTLARASRVTPAIMVARSALDDAMTARDRECKGGVGKFCREREAEVGLRRQALDAQSVKVEQGADPQTEAAMRIAVWVSGGLLKPTADDFAMLRLVLLALLPQIGGILLMIGRAK